MEGKMFIQKDFDFVLEDYFNQTNIIIISNYYIHPQSNLLLLFLAPTPISMGSSTLPRCCSLSAFNQPRRI